LFEDLILMAEGQIFYHGTRFFDFILCYSILFAARK
jgi:hypothetical protein